MRFFKKIKPGTPLVLLITAANSAQSDYIMDCLKKAGIVALRPSFTGIGMPGHRSKDSALEENIYVPQTDVDRASVVISKMGL